MAAATAAALGVATVVATVVAMAVAREEAARGVAVAGAGETEGRETKVGEGVAQIGCQGGRIDRNHIGPHVAGFSVAHHMNTTGCALRYEYHVSGHPHPSTRPCRRSSLGRKCDNSRL